MARFRTDGVDDIIQQMKELGELAGETADKMLHAGAEEVKKAWETEAQIHDFIDTRDMIDSIGFPSKPKTIKDMKVMDIYPQGKDRKGVRNAEKAFILHYGSSSIDSSHWVDDADERAEEPATKAMSEIWDEALKKKGII